MKGRVTEIGREGGRERWRKVWGEGLALAAAREKNRRRWERKHEQNRRDGVAINGFLSLCEFVCEAKMVFSEQTVGSHKPKPEQEGMFSSILSPNRPSPFLFEGELYTHLDQRRHTLVFPEAGRKRKTEGMVTGGFKSSSFMSVYLCWERRENRRAIVTSLVSLTEAGLMKPLGGCLTCVRMYVWVTAWAHGAIYSSLTSLGPGSLVIIQWF